MLRAVATHHSTGTGRCQFPGCHAEVPPRPPGQRGAPRAYCDNADHTAQKALRLRQRELRRDHQAEDTRQPSTRPVTDAKVTLGGLLDRYAELRAELSAVATDVGDVIADLGDPTVVEREIAEIQREAGRRITAAEQAQADAEKAVTDIARRLDHATELEALALAAAEEAHTVAQSATDRCGQIEEEAAQRVTAAEADRDAIYAEAESTLTEMRRHVDEARAAQARAEGERDAAREQHTALVEENKDLRADLERERGEHRAQIERRDSEYSRALTAAHAMADRAAREHRQQLSDVLNNHRMDGTSAIDAEDAPGFASVSE
ncbi:hypothetical protein [Nocardia takedensis]|uniref:hypothetical protein n=1 Tax=Nocardia takedensis TaxID=259390 RepID=UPI0002FB4F37|nr:hypothetical protein [Nocardia takedensis]